MILPLKHPLQRLVRATIGEIVAHEWLRTVTRAPSAIRNRRFENAEVARIGGPVATAEVVTVRVAAKG